MEQLTGNEFEIAAVDAVEATVEIERLPELTGQREAAEAHRDAADAVFRELEARDDELNVACRALNAKASSISTALHNLDLKNNTELIENCDAADPEALASQYRRHHDSLAQLYRAIALLTEVLRPEIGVKKFTAKVDSLGWQLTLLTVRGEESHVSTLKQMLPAIQSQGKMLVHAGAATRALRREATQVEATLTAAKQTLRAIEQEFEAIKASRGSNIAASLPR